MTDSEGEIECLDEDAEIVYQCMQYAYDNRPSNSKQIEPLAKAAEKRKRISIKDDDFDYDPSVDRPAHKRRGQLPRQNIKTQKIDRPARPNLFPDHIIRRKRMEIIIPDFEDPLCLPVKAVVKDSFESSRLKNWNNQCIAQLRDRSDSLATQGGNAVSSSRTIVLRTVWNRLTEKNEVSVKSKTSVKDQDGRQEHEVFQCILPRFREKKELSYWIAKGQAKKSHSMKTTSTVVLTAENEKDEERMVAYNVEQATAAVYSLVETPESELEVSSARYKRHLCERAACKTCAACHQASRRVTRARPARDINCAICSRHFVSIYNYLTHLKTHTAAEVKRYSKTISRTLSEVVEYHYECRICHRKCLSIKELRSHVKTHKCTEAFLCEVGNHLVK